MVKPDDLLGYRFVSISWRREALPDAGLGGVDVSVSVLVVIEMPIEGRPGPRQAAAAVLRVRYRAGVRQDRYPGRRRREFERDRSRDRI